MLIHCLPSYTDALLFRLHELSFILFSPNFFEYLPFHDSEARNIIIWDIHDYIMMEVSKVVALHSSPCDIVSGEIKFWFHFIQYVWWNALYL